jgi:DNA gyrase subunit A
MSIRFKEEEIRPMGRVAYGVRGIKLKKGDEVVSAEIVEQGCRVFTVTEKGYGKRAPCTGYRTQARGGSGIINVRCGQKNGQVVSLKKVGENDEIILVTDTGRTIRFAATDIPLQNRGGLGVKLMDLQNEKTISGVAIIGEDETVDEI